MFMELEAYQGDKDRIAEGTIPKIAFEKLGLEKVLTQSQLEGGYFEVGNNLYM